MSTGWELSHWPDEASCSACAGTPLVAEPAQGGQALLHQLDRTLMVAAQPGQLREADCRVYPVAFAAGFFS